MVALPSHVMDFVTRPSTSGQFRYETTLKIPIPNPFTYMYTNGLQYSCGQSKTTKKNKVIDPFFLVLELMHTSWVRILTKFHWNSTSCSWENCHLRKYDPENMKLSQEKFQKNAELIHFDNGSMFNMIDHRKTLKKINKLTFNHSLFYRNAAKEET